MMPTNVSHILIIGKLVGELTDRSTRKNKSSSSYDLYIDGDKLIVPDSEGKAVLYYKLQF